MKDGGGGHFSGQNSQTYFFWTEFTDILKAANYPDGIPEITFRKAHNLDEVGTSLDRIPKDMDVNKNFG